MTECVDCAILEAKIAAAGSRTSLYLRELDQQGDRVIHLERKLKAALDQHRHWIRISCDRCGDNMEFSTTLGSSMASRAAVIRHAAEVLGWSLSDATLTGVGCQSSTESAKDMCAACQRILNNHRGADV